MANKNQLERYILIDEMITGQHSKFPSSGEIISKCKQVTGFAYSKSAFEKDIRVMRDRYHAPIKYDLKKKGYCYTDTTYRFLKVGISRNDKVLLDLTRALLGADSTNAFLPFLEEIENTLKVNEQLERDQALPEVVQLDRIGCLNISEGLAHCITSLKEGKQLQFTYTKFDGEQTENRTIHPYILKEFKGRWFVTGWCTGAMAIRTFGLDRMRETKLLDKKVIPAAEKGFDTGAYYRHVYGITNDNGEPQEILLRFTPLQAKYLKTQPLHTSQQVVSEDKKEGTVFKLFLIPNHDLQMQLMSYGGEVEVLQPLSLRCEIREHLQRAVERYR